MLRALVFRDRCLAPDFLAAVNNTFVWGLSFRPQDFMRLILRTLRKFPSTQQFVDNTYLGPRTQHPTAPRLRSHHLCLRQSTFLIPCSKVVSRLTPRLLEES